ncbi:hypothetical protein E3J62_11585 [candidate division TA06 bacterium]|uniref:Uncharacterized protein n=1 Tax=candidate division TA06 bacterium TaxID=2250710 RepID=A0A523UNU6_UNCT6|nr:MAG: hypothetical protein E3J62_11585 [candidate division TA06 bacterium]
MKIVPVILAIVAIVAMGCGQVSQMLPTPEVVIVWVNPLTGVIDQASGDTTIAADTIRFQVANYVDAVVTNLEIKYFDSHGDSEIAPALPPINMHFVLPGDTTTVDLLHLPVPISQTLVDYIYNGNDYAIARLRFNGEDAYGLNKEFYVEMDWGIWRTDYP